MVLKADFQYYSHLHCQSTSLNECTVMQNPVKLKESQYVIVDLQLNV